MYDDAADDGMNELLAVLFVEEPAEVTYEPWNFLVGRWDVDNLVSDAILHYHFVVASEASGIVRVLHRFVCHQAMYLQQQIFGQGHIFVIYNKLDGLVIVVNHLLRLVSRNHLLPEHFLRNFSRCGSSFHLTGEYGFFH